MRARPLTLIQDELVDYDKAMERMAELVDERQRDARPDTLWLLSHPQVYTVGRRTPSAHLPDPSRGIPVVETGRGGQLTYHGPGQLVGYPIMHVASVPEYILTMERAIVTALGRAGVEAQTRLGHKHVGVWVGERKIASVGVHLSHGVSSHGFAVNVDNDLDPFTWVVACGLPDVQMTSLAAEGTSEGVACFRKRMGHAFCEAFGVRQRLVSPTRLGIGEPVVA